MCIRDRDDAAASPDAGARGDVDVPAVLSRAGLDEVQTLGVRDDLGRPERLADVLDESGLVVDGDSRWAAQRGLPRGAQLRAGRHGASEHSLGDRVGRYAETERLLDGPRP